MVLLLHAALSKAKNETQRCISGGSELFTRPLSPMRESDDGFFTGKNVEG